MTCKVRIIWRESTNLDQTDRELFEEWISEVIDFFTLYCPELEETRVIITRDIYIDYFFYLQTLKERRRYDIYINYNMFEELNLSPDEVKKLIIYCLVKAMVTIYLLDYANFKTLHFIQPHYLLIDDLSIISRITLLISDSVANIIEALLLLTLFGKHHLVLKSYLEGEKTSVKLVKIVSEEGRLRRVLSNVMLLLHAIEVKKSTSLVSTTDPYYEVLKALVEVYEDIRKYVKCSYRLKSSEVNRLHYYLCIVRDLASLLVILNFSTDKEMKREAEEIMREYFGRELKKDELEALQWTVSVIKGWYKEYFAKLLSSTEKEDIYYYSSLLALNIFAVLVAYVYLTERGHKPNYDEISKYMRFVLRKWVKVKSKHFAISTV